MPSGCGHSLQFNGLHLPHVGASLLAMGPVLPTTFLINQRNPSRNCPGVIPVQRLKARLKLLVSANPSR